MTLGFICIKNPFNLPGKTAIYSGQSLGDVLMDRTLADAKEFCGLSHRRPSVRDILAEIQNAFLDVILHFPPTLSI